MKAFLSTIKSYALPLAVLVVAWIVISAITPSFRGAASVFSVLVLGVFGFRRRYFATDSVLSTLS